MSTFMEAEAALPGRERGLPVEQASLLLFAAEPLGSEIALMLRFQLSATVTIVGSSSHCLNAMRRHSFDLLLLEESIATLDPDGTDALYEAAGAAMVVEINFGVMRADRIAQAARSALRRRRLDLQRAETAARLALWREMTSSVTGLLLESQLALRQAGPNPTPALQRLVDLAEHVCLQLRADGDRSV